MRRLGDCIVCAASAKSRRRLGSQVAVVRADYDKAGVHLDPVDTWLLCHLRRDGPVSVPRAGQLLHRSALDVSTRFTRLVSDGMIIAIDGGFRPTLWGDAIVDQLRAPEQHDELPQRLAASSTDLLRVIQ
jgi:hypothetical protein